MAVFYSSGTLSLAALEMLVQTDIDDAPDDLVAISVDIREGVRVLSIEIGDLPQDWRSFPAPPALQQIGAAWVRAMETSVLSVPSVVIPSERNFVLNPAHPGFARLSIGKPERFSLDPRLISGKP